MDDLPDFLKPRRREMPPVNYPRRENAPGRESFDNPQMAKDIVVRPRCSGKNDRTAGTASSDEAPTADEKVQGNYCANLDKVVCLALVPPGRAG